MIHFISSFTFRPDSEDEMCNLYIMYYTVNDDRNLLKDECWDPPPPWFQFPTKLPRLPTHSHNEEEEEGDGHLHEIDENSQNEKQDCPVPIPTGLKRCPVPNLATTSPPETIPSAVSDSVPSPVPDSIPSPTPNSIPSPTQHSPPLPELTATRPPPSGALVLSENWLLNGFPIPEATLGQVTAAAVDAAGDLHVLHRGPVTWEFE